MGSTTVTLFLYSTMRVISNPNFFNKYLIGFDSSLYYYCKPMNISRSCYLSSSASKSLPKSINLSSKFTTNFSFIFSVNYSSFVNLIGSNSNSYFSYLGGYFPFTASLLKNLLLFLFKALLCCCFLISMFYMVAIMLRNYCCQCTNCSGDFENLMIKVLRTLIDVCA